LCGYCGKLLNDFDSHIEHVIPRSKVSDYGIGDHTFDNLLVSCPEDSYEEGVNTCGHAKGAWYDPSLFVSPYDQDCESYFTYSELGQIMPPTNDPQVQEYRKATTTIARLALDTYELSEARRGMIEGLLGEEPWSLSQGELCQLLEVVQTPDHEGRLRPYCFAIKHVIEQYLQSQTC
ncbi:MAG: retron system putative HNH endonuclease, partial [Tumebacillaceae bacterium]